MSSVYEKFVAYSAARQQGDDTLSFAELTSFCDEDSPVSKERTRHLVYCSKCKQRGILSPARCYGGGTPGDRPKYRWYCTNEQCTGSSSGGRYKFQRDRTPDPVTGVYAESEAFFAVDDEPRKQYSCRKCGAKQKKDHVCPYKLFAPGLFDTTIDQTFDLTPPKPLHLDPLDAGTFLGDPGDPPLNLFPMASDPPVTMQVPPVAVPPQAATEAMSQAVSQPMSQLMSQPISIQATPVPQAATQTAQAPIPSQATPMPQAASQTTSQPMSQPMPTQATPMPQAATQAASQTTPSQQMSQPIPTEATPVSQPVTLQPNQATSVSTPVLQDVSQDVSPSDPNLSLNAFASIALGTPGGTTTTGTASCVESPESESPKTIVAGVLASMSAKSAKGVCTATKGKRKLREEHTEHTDPAGQGTNAHAMGRNMNGLEFFALFSLRLIHVTGDGSCWVYALLAACGLLQSANERTAATPSARDRAADTICRALSALWCNAHTKGLCSQDLKTIPTITTQPLYQNDNLLQFGSFGDGLTIMGLAAYMKISVVLWNAKTIRTRNVKHQVLVYSPTKEDEYKMKQLHWHVRKIIAYCNANPGRVAHLEFNGSNHFNCRQGSTVVSVPAVMRDAIENGVPEFQAYQGTQCVAPMSPCKKVRKTSKTTKASDTPVALKKRRGVMQLKAVFPEHFQQNMPRADDIAYSLNLLDDLMGLDKEWSIEDFAQHAYALGYDLFVLGWPDCLKGPCNADNVEYMHCFKLKHAVSRVCFDAALPKGVRQVMLYSL